MILLVCSFLTAFLVTLLAVRSAASHAHLSGDTDKNQPQKFHAQVVPRIGGVGIVMGVVAGGALAVHRGLAGWEMLLGANLAAFRNDISSITAAAYPFYSSHSCHLMIHSPQHPNLVCTGCLWHVLQPDRAVPLPLQLCVRPLLQLP